MKHNLEKDSKMKLSSFLIGLICLMAPLLTACHTVEGMGTDVKKTGNAIENTASATRRSL